MIQSVLKDASILICRPEPSATEFAAALNAVGAQCQTLPCLHINTLELAPNERQHILDLDQYSHVIALSQYAAEPAITLIDEYWPQPPVQQQWFAIGRSTANVIAGTIDSLVKPEADLTSEELLELPELQDMSEAKVLILKGREGRVTIEEALVKRGATVDNLELYERVAPVYTDDEIRAPLDHVKSGYIVALSGETVKNLKGFADQIEVDLSEHHLIVPSERVAHIAMQQGFNLTYIPNNLKPIDIIRCIAGIENELKQKKN